MLNIASESTENTVILSPFGRIDHGSSDQFEESLLSALNGDVYRIIVDFSNLNYISSSGLRVLLIAERTAKKNQRAFFLSGIPEHIYEILEVAGFNTIFSIYTTSQEALESQ